MSLKIRKRLSLIFLGILGFYIVFLGYGVFKWKTYIWLPNYIFNENYFDINKYKNIQTHIFLIIANHYEPGRGNKGIFRSREWLNKYRSFAKRHVDSNGRILQHSWFYPMEQFEDEIMEDLTKMVKEGYGEIELHWHHGNDNSETFERKLKEGLKKFNKYGALIGKDGKVSFGFIHGNWGLDNSRGNRFCGVNNEIEILARNGCYADFTFSLIGNNAQPKKINSIYYAKDNHLPKSYNDGIDMEVGKSTNGDLVIFQGPIGYIFINPLISKYYSPFYLEYGAVENDPKPSPFRVENWLKLSVFVKGKPEWRFIKLYTHGIQSIKGFFSDEMEQTLLKLKKEITNKGWTLHYITAREAYNIAKAAEAGFKGDPLIYYNWLIKEPKTRME